MYTGRAIKSNIEWLVVRIRRARNRSRLGKSSIIFKSICWSSRALLSNGYAIVVLVRPSDNNDDDNNLNCLKVPSRLQCINDILIRSDILYDKNRLKESKTVLDQYSVSCIQKVTENPSRLRSTAIIKIDVNELQDQSVPEIKWRQARLFYSLSKSAKNKTERHSHIYTAYHLIRSALANCKENFAIHKWMAIILDAKAELDGVRSRIMHFTRVQHHMEQAVKLNPNDPGSWYFLGAFEFGLADLSWLHRKLISTITQTTVPEGSYEKAFQHFQYAEKIQPGFYSKNLLMLGKCSLAMQKLQDAKDFLKKVTNFQVINREDRQCQKEAVELLRKIGNRTKCK